MTDRPLVVLAKTCNTCGKGKPAHAFRRHSNMADGLLSRCRECDASQRRSRRQQLTAERLRKLLHYDPANGAFTHAAAASQMPAGSEAGYVDDNGYLVISVDGYQDRAQRLAWLYMTGQWPARQVDHADTDKLNNRWANLRLATPAQNGQNCPRKSNNKSGAKGVSWFKSGQKWRARITVSGREISLGYFNSFDEAKAAYASAASHHFGEFARAE